MPDCYPPGPSDNLVQAILSTRRQQQDRLHFLVDMARSYGDVCHFRPGLRHVYLLNHPDYIHAVLSGTLTPLFVKRQGKILPLPFPANLLMTLSKAGKNLR